MNYKKEWDYQLLLGKNFNADTEKKLLEKTIASFESKWKTRKDYVTDEKALKTALDDYEKLTRICYGGGVHGYHLWLQSSKDQSSTKIKAQWNKFNEFERELALRVAFFRLTLAKTESAMQKKFLASPLLKEYHHFLERVFLESKHNLSEPEEKILALKSKPSHSNWTDMTSTFLSKEEREVLLPDGTRAVKNFSEINGLINHENKKVRDGAAAVFNEILDKHKESAEFEMNSIFENHRIDTKLGRYSRPDEPRHLADDIDSKSVDTLVKTVSSRFDLPQRYYRLKAALFKKPKLQYHERTVPYGSTKKEFSFDEAYSMVNSVFKSLDPSFSSIFQSFCKNGQVDVFPKKGKRGGAFCIWWGVSHPVHVLLNHTSTLNNVCTLAHEFGHAINGELSKKQNALSYDIPTSFAEVASTFMEDFVLEELRKEADEHLRFNLLVTKLDDDVSSIFRQIACYMLEQELHKEAAEKGYLSHEEIGKIFLKNMAAYMGSAVEQSPGSQNWWIYWSHLRSFFYTYSYAYGLLISKRLQAEVRKDKQFVRQVKELFSAGNSQSPKDLFASVGFDTTKSEFWNKGLDEFEHALNEAEKLAKKLGKI